MDYKNLLTTTSKGILTITINRPEKLNALNKDTLFELSQAVTAALADTYVEGILITGAGEKAFVAGADISEFSSFTAKQGEELAKEGHANVFDLIANSPKPILAAINGFALGGGLELALACHIRFASENAKLGLPEVTLGLIPGYGGTQRLTQLVGKGKAFEIILSADMVDACEAQKIGLINRVVPLSDLLEESSKLLKTITSRSPNAVSAAIVAINAATDTQKNGFNTEIEQFAKCFNHPDFIEGVNAFLEKRKPNFR